MTHPSSLQPLLLFAAAAGIGCVDGQPVTRAQSDGSAAVGPVDVTDDAGGHATQSEAGIATDPTDASAASGDAATPREADADAAVDANTDARGDDRSDAARATEAGASKPEAGVVPDSGCPLDLEGFATLQADGQNGTFGGRDGQTVTVSTQAELDRYATALEPYTIRVEGEITLTPKGTEIRVASDKTIVGVGATGGIVQGGFMLEPGVHNVIIRNLTISGAFVEGDWEGKTNDFDAIQMDSAHHVWIDHCHLHHMGDGLIDSRKDTSYLSVSWNVFSDHNKTFGIGWTENVTAQITIHHNLFRDVNQRVPSVDNVLRAHLYNNRLLRVTAYGNYARGGTNMVLENSVFDRVADPHYGDTGSLVATGNIYRDTSGMRETVGKQFFVPRELYAYALDAADKVEATLDRCAGPRPELGR